jgi:trigger factor
LNGRVETQVEELPENRVRLTVEVPREDVKHAVDHAASDLAESVRIPGFRRGKVPMQVLIARVGRERVYSEAVESHIGGWFRNAVVGSKIRPVSRPEYEYDLPTTGDEAFQFKATVAVQPKIEPADWTKLEVPRGEAEVPADLVDRELEALRESVAELAPVEDRPAREGDTVVLDLVDPSGEAQRDYVVELGAARLIEEIEQAIVGMSAGESQQVEYEAGDDSTAQVEVTLKEIKEKVLPPLDDELARAASEFDTVEQLRADIEGRLREQLEEEIEGQFRAAAADRLVEATGVRPSGQLVESRANELLAGLLRTLERRGISADTYLAVTNQTPEQLRERLTAEAAQSVARELVLEAVAEKAGLEVTDEELKDFIREQAREAGEEDVEAVVDGIWQNGRHELLREDLLLRRALDRVVAEVKPIPVDLARAREKLWTPEKETTPGERNIWTPGQREEKHV